jgi:microcystin-dependent protein
MPNLYKDLLGVEDIQFDTDGNAEVFSRRISTGSFQNFTKFNAGHLPLIAATRTAALYNAGVLNANDVDAAIAAICASLATVPVFSNKAVLDAIQSAGSGAIMTTSEREKLNSILSIGSGSIITSQERAKLAGLTALTEDELAIVAQVADLFPVGCIVAFPTNSVPTSFLECNGAALLRATYSELYGVIGTDYGYTDATDFYLPDYRGRFLRGWDHGAGNDPDSGSRTNRGDGTGGDNVGTIQADEFKSHDHEIDRLRSTGTSTGSYIEDCNSSGSSSSCDTLTSGGSETRPKNVNTMYCIRYQASTS